MGDKPIRNAECGMRNYNSKHQNGDMEKKDKGIGDGGKRLMGG
jgi:hypothetical protein